MVISAIVVKGVRRCELEQRHLRQYRPVNADWTVILCAENDELQNPQLITQFDYSGRNQSAWWINTRMKVTILGEAITEWENV